jgi:hypothetical protein
METWVEIEGRRVSPIVKWEFHPTLRNALWFTFANGNKWAIVIDSKVPYYGYTSIRTGMAFMFGLGATPENIRRMFDTFELFKEVMDVMGIKIGESLNPLHPKETSTGAFVLV